MGSRVILMLDGVRVAVGIVGKVGHALNKNYCRIIKISYTHNSYHLNSFEAKSEAFPLLISCKKTNIYCPSTSPNYSASSVL